MIAFGTLIENAPWLILAFAFLLGTIIGSFLNVVIYRLPRGMNLVYPASHCPRCNKPIRWYDNVPIFGWLWLRGRCRDCGARISARYPLIELATGAIFLVVGYTDVVRPYVAKRLRIEEQMDLEKQSPEPPEIAQIPLDRYLVRYGYHLILLCPLLAAALVDFDGQKLPRRLITWPAAAGILVAFAVPPVQDLSLDFRSHASTGTASLWALITSLAGLILAVLIRLGTFNALGYQRPRELGLLSATLALYAVGAFLGWQAVGANCRGLPPCGRLPRRPQSIGGQ